jgi:hypothetical protein
MKNLLPAMLVFFSSFVTTRAQVDTTSVVNAWKFDSYYTQRIPVTVDTVLDDFQRHSPLFRNFTSVSTLGNYGLPAISNVFTERELDQEYILINTFFPFIKTIRNTAYFNTHKPFTRLSYVKGGGSQNKEEILDALHTQNLTRSLNFGLHYTTVGAFGQYSFQRVKHNSFRFFSDLLGNLYSYHMSFNMNKIVADENGGVANDSLVTDTTYAFTKDIPTLFGGIDNTSRHEPDVYNEIRNMSLFTMQELAFRQGKTTADTTRTNRKIRIFYPKLIYIFSFDRYSRLFKDLKPDVGLESGLYPAILINDKETSDSLVYWKLFNAARLQFQGKRNNHYFIDYAYEMMQYSLFVPSENPAGDSAGKPWFISQEIQLPGIKYRNRQVNSYLSSNFSRTFANHLELNLYGRYYLTGYRRGNFYLAGTLSLFTGKAGRINSLLISGVNELKSPDFLYTHYASNNFVWTKSFKQTNLNSLSTKLSISSKKFEFQADYFLIRNFIFLNEEATPEQYHNGLSILALGLYKRFDIWKLTSINKIVYQKVDNDRVLSLPEIVVNNSTYLKHLFNFRATGGKLLTMIGFDFFYNTKYYANAYMPPLASFYQQSLKKLGNYPYFDVFLNVRLKRLRFFLKLEHINSGWIDKNYFSVLHYPRNERYLKYGLSWTFYD